LLADRAGFSRQHQKGRLTGVLSILLMMQDGLANGEHHAAVPSHQGGKGGLVLPGQKLLEQLPVGLPAGLGVGDNLAQVAQDQD
jgi:hypothetical protein